MPLKSQWKQFIQSQSGLKGSGQPLLGDTDRTLNRWDRCSEHCTVVSASPATKAMQTVLGSSILSSYHVSLSNSTNSKGKGNAGKEPRHPEDPWPTERAHNLYFKSLTVAYGEIVEKVSTHFHQLPLGCGINISYPLIYIFMLSNISSKSICVLCYDETPFGQ